MVYIAGHYSNPLVYQPGRHMHDKIMGQMVRFSVGMGAHSFRMDF